MRHRTHISKKNINRKIQTQILVVLGVADDGSDGSKAPKGVCLAVFS